MNKVYVFTTLVVVASIVGIGLLISVWLGVMERRLVFSRSCVPCTTFPARKCVAVFFEKPFSSNFPRTRITQRQQRGDDYKRLQQSCSMYRQDMLPQDDIDFTRPEEAVSRISSHENRQIAKLESLIAESNLLETSNFENNSDSLYLERMVSAIYQLSPEVSEPIGASNKPSSTLNPITFSHPTTTVTERSVVNFSQSVGSLFAEKNVRTARAKLSTLSATKEKRETTNFTQQISNDVNEDKYSNGEKVTAENRINVYSTAAASRLFDLSTKIKLNKSKAGSQAVLLTSNQMAWATSAGKSSSSRSFRNTTAIPQHERSFQEVNIVSSTTAELTINNRDTLSNWEVENDEYVASVDDFSGVVDLATQPFITQKLITVDKQPKLKIIQKHQIEQSHVVSTSRTRDIRSIQSIPEPQAQVQQPVRKTSLLYLCGVINRRFRICKPKSHQKHTSQCNSRQLSMTGRMVCITCIQYHYCERSGSPFI